MDAAALLTALAVLILVAIFVARPLLQRGSTPSRRSAEVSSLEAELDRTIDTLRELEFDRALGKIPDDEFPTRRQELVARGADQLRRLDEVRGSPDEAAANRARTFERQVASRRGVPAATREAALEAEIAARRTPSGTGNGNGRKAGFCPACGSPVQVGDKFCPRCGNTLRHETST
jgi:zinc-ribbon domain